jgi:hypothetical protein
VGASKGPVRVAKDRSADDVADLLGWALLGIQRCCPLGELLELTLELLAPHRTTLILDQTAAQQARFAGSPTVRVDGRDVEPGSEPPSEISVACRLYRLEHRLAGRPAERWVRDALPRATGRT